MQTEHNTHTEPETPRHPALWWLLGAAFSVVFCLLDSVVRGGV